MTRDTDLFARLQGTLGDLLEKHGLKDQNIIIRGAVLSPEEAIGRPQRRDFPIQKGKEKLMQAAFRGACGQAFTDMSRDFRGRLGDLVTMPVRTNYDRAVFVSGLNAVAAYLKMADHTIHCKDEAPHRCSEKLVAKVREEYGNPRIAFFGLQPAMVEALQPHFEMRVFDLDPDNTGREKCGVKIESGALDPRAVERWADLYIVTGSTVCNATLPDFLGLRKPVIYFGTTIAGTAAILGLERFCPESRSQGRHPKATLSKQPNGGFPG